MVKTAFSIVVTFALIIGISIYEGFQVRRSFTAVRSALTALYKKTEDELATYEDGNIVRKTWEREKKDLHFWIPHTVIENVDYQLNEMLGYLYEYDYQDALPKLEILIEITEYLPKTYTLSLENIF
jgi:hypothetical protein